MRRFASILTVGLLLAVAGPAIAQAEPGASARAAAGGASAPEAGNSGTTGGASYATLQQLDAERDAKRRVAAERAAKQRKRRIAARRAAARKRARMRAQAKARARKRAAKRRTGVPKPPAPAPTSDHTFPVAGAYSFGGKDGRFGAGRKGHIHQGQDIAATEGVPVVAPWPSTVEAVKYQPGGAGYYIVLDGDGEDRDYVFMHLRKGSTLVKVGDAVVRGEQIAQVGSTGSSSGAHLHFEIWVAGGWYTGGHPVDPLPFLNAWLQ